MSYTSAQAAIELGVSKGTLSRWRSEGKLLPDSKTIGGHSRYSKAQIDKIKINDGISHQPAQLKKVTTEDLL